MCTVLSHEVYGAQHTKSKKIQENESLIKELNMNKIQNEPLNPVLTNVKTGVLNSSSTSVHLNKYNVYFLNYHVNIICSVLFHSLGICLYSEPRAYVGYVACFVFGSSATKHIFQTKPFLASP